MGVDVKIMEVENNFKCKNLMNIIVRFAGDSGDGMQLVGSEFSKSVAISGNMISTLPDYPAEIRAPAGTTYGVSGFQIQFGANNILTPGEQPDVLVAMNPAALKMNISDVKYGGILIINKSTFTKNNLFKAKYKDNPLYDGSLSSFNVISVDINKLIHEALKGIKELSNKDINRSKNFWALGLMYFMFSHSLDEPIKSIKRKFKHNSIMVSSNILALKSGYNYGDITEQIGYKCFIKKANLDKGEYRSITGNNAIVLGLVSAAYKANLPLFLGSYPITPASDILHMMSSLKDYNVTTFQAEDEISAIGSAIGAAYGGSIAVTSTSGPGFALKTEALGLSLMLELPVVVINVQRAGPSTGMPTKSEQSDLLMAMYGRNGESSLPVLAPKSPNDCFMAAFEACYIAIKYMTPVILLSDSFIANSAELWKIINFDSLCSMNVQFNDKNINAFFRNKETLARTWAIPGIKNCAYRVGGLEKDQFTGAVSQDPINHANMVKLRFKKILNIKKSIIDLAFDFWGKNSGKILLLGWGSSFGSLRQITKTLYEHGWSIAHLNLRWINPLSDKLDKILNNFTLILVCEFNLGQLYKILQATYKLPMEQFNSMLGKAFLASDIKGAIKTYLSDVK